MSDQYRSHRWCPNTSFVTLFTSFLPVKIEQLEQKAEKRARSREYQVVERYTGWWFPCTKGLGTCCHPPCTDEPRIGLQPGDIVAVTRWKKLVFSVLDPYLKFPHFSHEFSALVPHTDNYYQDFLTLISLHHRNTTQTLTTPSPPTFFPPAQVLAVWGAHQWPGHH